MCPAAPPTTAPLMQPFASALGAEAIAIAAAKTAANIHFMTALRYWKPLGQFDPEEVVPDFCAAKRQVSVCQALPEWLVEVEAVAVLDA
jgi:hypothetical protein